MKTKYPYLSFGLLLGLLLQLQTGWSQTNQPVLDAFVRIEKVLADQAYKGPLGAELEKAHQCR